MALTTTYVHNYILSSLSRQLIFKKSVIFSPLLYVLIVLVSPALSTSMEFSITVMEHSTFAVISNNLTSTKVVLFKCDECAGGALIDESSCRALFIFQLKDEYDSNVNKNNQQIFYYLKKLKLHINIKNIKDIQWIITVPAIWDDIAKNDGNSTNDNDTNDNDLNIYICSSYVLTDSGGGTFDNMKIKEIFNPPGDAWGSTYIDDEFIKILNNFTSSKHTFYNKYDEDNDNITQTLYNKFTRVLSDGETLGAQELLRLKYIGTFFIMLLALCNDDLNAAIIGQ